MLVWLAAQEPQVIRLLEESLDRIKTDVINFQIFCLLVIFLSYFVTEDIVYECVVELCFIKNHKNKLNKWSSCELIVDTVSVCTYGILF